MADKKISQFDTFDGAQGPTVYFVIASGDSSDPLAKNYKVPFTSLTSDILKAGSFWKSGSDYIYTLTGKVGLGANNPAYQLHASGTGLFSHDLIASGLISGVSGEYGVITGTTGHFPHFSGHTVEVSGGYAKFHDNVYVSGDMYITGDLHVNPNTIYLGDAGISGSNGVVHMGSGAFAEVLTISGVPVSTGDGGGAGKWEDGATVGEIYYDAGKVGVGTNDPHSSLEVSANDTETDWANFDTDGSIRVKNTSNNPGTFSALHLHGGSRNNASVIGVTVDRAAGAPEGALALCTVGKDTAGTPDHHWPRIIITGDQGDVGIGTFKGFSAAETHPPRDKLEVGGATNGAGICFDNGVDTDARLWNYRQGKLKLYTNNDPLKGLTIDINGKVGIGTDTNHLTLNLKGGNAGISYFDTSNPTPRTWATFANDNVLKFSPHPDSAAGSANDMSSYVHINDAIAHAGGNTSAGQASLIIGWDTPVAIGGTDGATVLSTSRLAVVKGATTPAAAECIFSIQSNGEAMFPAYVAGDVTFNADGVLQSSSDVRLKNDAGAVEYGLSDVLQLEPRKFRWKSDPEGDVQLGFYSQEVHEVIPEAAPRIPVTGENGEEDYSWGLYDRALIGALVNSVKELKQENDDLKSCLDAAGL